MMRFSNLRWHRGIPSSADTYLCLQGIFLWDFQYKYLLEEKSKNIQSNWKLRHSSKGSALLTVYMIV
jgi:hypothetical protein